METTTSRKIQIDNKWYRLHSHIPITDFQGKKVGTLVFLQDISREHTLLLTTVVVTIFLSLMVLALVWNLLKKYMGKIIDDLIASRKKARHDVEELRKFKIILDNLNFGIATADQDGRLGYINNYFAANHGYKTQELHGQPLSIFHSDEQLEEVGKILRSCLQEGVFDLTTVWHKHRDGSLFPMEMNGVIIKDIRAEDPFVVCMAIDITKRLQLEQKLQDYSDLLETMVDQRTEALTVSNEKLHYEIKERLKVEKDLRMFKVFSESSSEGMGWSDIDGTIIYINPALTKLFGEKDPKALLGKSVIGCYPDDEQERLRDEIFPTILKHGSWSGELMLQQTNGKKIPTHNTLFLISNEAMEPIFYANIVTDITERKKIEKDLNIFKSFAESSNQGIGWASVDGAIVYTNPAITKLFGEKDLKTLIGKNVITTYYAEDEQQRLTEEILPALVKDGSWSGELMIQQENGKLIPTHNSFFLISNEALEPMFFANIVTDITEHKKIEKDLNIFKSFAESSNQGMGWTSMDGTIVYTNPAATKLFGGNDQKTLIGKNVITTYYAEDEQQRLTEKILPALVKDGSWSGELMIQQENGKLIPTHNSFFLITNQALEPIFFANIVRDITELKQAEERIKQSLHEKEILLKEIHHRVKNNLQVASSMLYLQAKKIGNEDVQEVLLNSRDRIKSMALVHETLYQSGDLSCVDFVQYIQTLVKHVFRTYQNRSRKIIPKINMNNISLNIDAAIPCGLIINELVSNSFKHGFLKNNGEIRVKMIKEEDHFVLTVSDNGTGFPEDIDFRNSTSVGLQLITSLVKQLGGTIELRRNHGTEFTIIFTEPAYFPRI